MKSILKIDLDTKTILAAMLKRFFKYRYMSVYYSQPTTALLKYYSLHRILTITPITIEVAIIDHKVPSS